ncbi:hypothetical protein ACQR5W_11750 [Xanthomonas sacchari]
MKGTLVRLTPIAASHRAGQGGYSARPVISMLCEVPQFDSFMTSDGIETAKFKWFLVVYRGVETNERIQAEGGIGYITLQLPEVGEDPSDGEVTGWVSMEPEKFDSMLRLMSSGKNLTNVCLEAQAFRYGQFPDGADKVWENDKGGLIDSIEYTFRLVKEPDERQGAEPGVAPMPLPQPVAAATKSGASPVLWFIAGALAVLLVKAII